LSTVVDEKSVHHLVELLYSKALDSLGGCSESPTRFASGIVSSTKSHLQVQVQSGEVKATPNESPSMSQTTQTTAEQAPRTEVEDGTDGEKAVVFFITQNRVDDEKGSSMHPEC
jgi:DNA-directed RNA polymerase subunit M/transcription elongation factor TFIIS